MPFTIWILLIRSFLKNMQDIQNSKVSISNHKSYTTNFTNGNIGIDFNNSTIKLPKLKQIKAKLHREFSGQIKSATISQVPSEKLFTLMLILATTSSILSIPTFAEEISTKEENTIELEKIEEVEPRASLYFSSYTYDLEPSSKNGYLDFSSLVVRTNRTDELTLPCLKAWGS